MSNSKRNMRLMALLLSGIVFSGCASGGFSSNASYKKRPGWQPVLILAADDCKTWKSGGKSLIDWNGEACSAEGLIQSVNKKPENIPAFYAAYHEYGTGGVRAIDVTDNSPLNYLNFAHSLAEKLSSQAVVSNIYNDYKVDRKAMGLDEVSQADFIRKLNELSSRKDAIYQRMNEVAKEDYDKSSTANSGKSLGLNYKASCGPFSIDLSSSDGWARINGDKPETQKIKQLGNGGAVTSEPGNVKMEWVVESSKDGQLYGLEYIKRNGKAFLNAQILQASMDAPRAYGTFDCVKVK